MAKADPPCGEEDMDCWVSFCEAFGCADDLKKGRLGKGKKGARGGSGFSKFFAGRRGFSKFFAGRRG